MNWHGKPLGGKAEEVIAAIKANMSTQDPLDLRPQPITATAPTVDISNITLSEPPKYTLGQEVTYTMGKLVTFTTLSKRLFLHPRPSGNLHHRPRVTLTP